MGELVVGDFGKKRPGSKSGVKAHVVTADAKAANSVAPPSMPPSELECLDDQIIMCDMFYMAGDPDPIVKFSLRIEEIRKVIFAEQLSSAESKVVKDQWVSIRFYPIVSLIEELLPASKGNLEEKKCYFAAIVLECDRRMHRIQELNTAG